jgi:NADH-quinone oxidoreductase subunit M
MSLLLLILIPLIGALIALLTKSDRNYAIHNVYNVASVSLGTNIVVILYVFSLMNVEKNGIQMVEKYIWNMFPSIEILLGVDIFSLLLLLGINLSFFVAGITIRHKTDFPKALISSELLFIGLLNGYLISADIFSFYVFFTSLCMPVIILISAYGSQRKKNFLVRFGLYNLVGILFLLCAIILIYQIKGSNIPLNTVGNVSYANDIIYFIWFGIFVAFISKLPIWPFHYWIAAINSTLKNSLVFIASSLLPLVGLYGFIRFWPNTVPVSIGRYSFVLEFICITTMLFVALVSLCHKDLRYKLFAYTTVYYLLYLTGVFLPTSILKSNIGYSLFSYIIIVTVLSLLIGHIEEEKKKLTVYGNSGMLCYMPKVSKCLSLFVLAGIGLPITPLFWNNFIIISEVFNYNLGFGIFVMLALFIEALSLLEELYHMKDKHVPVTACFNVADLSQSRFIIYMGVLVVLFFSFFKPLWFVF